MGSADPWSTNVGRKLRGGSNRALRQRSEIVHQRLHARIRARNGKSQGCAQRDADDADAVDLRPDDRLQANASCTVSIQGMKFWNSVPKDARLSPVRSR